MESVKGVEPSTTAWKTVMLPLHYTDIYERGFIKRPYSHQLLLATPKGFEPSTSSVTGWRSSRLNYGAVYSREYSIPHLTERGATPGGLERSDLSLNLRHFKSA